MEIESLIPFGLDVVSEQLVDVGSVKRGNACGCICPSCKTPLVARHGDKKVWHFSHRSQNTHNKTRKECEYSFVVSVRLMIRQLSNEGLKFRTPKFECPIPAYSDYSHVSSDFSYVVTKESLLELSNVQVGTDFCGVVVDVLGYIEGIPFVVYITYKGRPVPSELISPSVTRSGVVELNVNFLPGIFKKEENGQYKEVLRRYVENEVSGKAWVYHPREHKLREVAIARRQSWLSEQKDLFLKSSTSLPKKFKHPRQNFGNYTCVMCKSTWSGTSRICEKCNTHLYTIEK